MRDTHTASEGAQLHHGNLRALDGFVRLRRPELSRVDAVYLAPMLDLDPEIPAIFVRSRFQGQRRVLEVRPYWSVCPSATRPFPMAKAVAAVPVRLPAARADRIGIECARAGRIKERVAETTLPCLSLDRCRRPTSKPKAEGRSSGQPPNTGTDPCCFRN